MPAYKGTKVLGTLRGGVHPKKTAPVAGKTGTQGARTTDPKMVGKPTMSNKNKDPNNTYTRAMASPKPKAPPVVSAAERAAIANRDPARARAAMKAVAREGTTSAAGGRPAPAKPQKAISLTVRMKPTPSGKKK